MPDPWVAPDSQPASPVPTATAPAVPAGEVRRVADGDGAPPVPVPLRPLTIPDILDGALRAWKLAPAAVVGLAAAFVVPAQGLLGVLTRDEVDDADLGESFNEIFTTTGSDDVDAGLGGSFFLSVLVQGIALAFVTAGVATLISGWYVGRRTGPGELIVGALRRWWPLVIAWVAVHAVEAVFAIALFVPALVPMTWFAVVSAVVACEGAGPFRAMRRSARLVNRRFGAVLGTCLLVALVDLVLTGALTALATFYVELDLPLAWVINALVSAGALLITTPFVAGVVTLLYLDLRVRTEGLDIELAASRRLPL